MAGLGDFASGLGVKQGVAVSSGGLAVDVGPAEVVGDMHLPEGSLAVLHALQVSRGSALRGGVGVSGSLSVNGAVSNLHEGLHSAGLQIQGTGLVSRGERQ